MARALSCPSCGSAYLTPVREGEGSEVLCGVCRSLLAAPVRASLFRRLAVRRRRVGLLRLVRLAAGRVVDVRGYLVYAAACKDVLVVPPPAGVELGSFREADLADLAEFVPRGEMRRRLERGERGIVARVDGKPVGCVWVAEEPRIRRFPVPVTLGRDEAYADGLYVRSAHRNGGTGRALSTARASVALGLGYGTVVSHVRTTNLPARRLYASQGLEPREVVLVVTLLGRWRVVRRRPAKEERGSRVGPAR